VSWWNGPDTGGKKEETQQKSIFFPFKKERKKGKQVSGFSRFFWCCPGSDAYQKSL
jgi:hypothetical protein